MRGVGRITICSILILILIFSSLEPGLLTKYIFAQSQELISVTTDKTSYTYGDTITISGSVNPVIQNQKITITLKSSGGKSGVIGSAFPNPDGTFSLTSGNITSQYFPLGQYIVMIRYGGYSTQTTFTVVSTPLQPVENSPTQTPSNIMQPTNTTIPSWIKNNAKWWSEGSLADSDFLQGIQYLIQQGIIVISTTQNNPNSSQGIPSWIKGTAKWWAEGQVGDSDFVKAMQYLVQNGIININSNNVNSNDISQQETDFEDLENKCEKRYGPIMYYDAAQKKCMPIGGSNGIIAQPQYQESDNMGMVHFKIGGQTVSFRFYNETSGSPISGLAVVFALDKPTQSVGVIVVVDPNNNYPPQLVFLSGKAPITIPTSWKSNLLPQAYATESNSDDSSTVYQIATSARSRQVEIEATPFIPFNHKIGEITKGVEGTDLLGLIGNAVTLLGTNNVKLKALAHTNNVDVLSYDQAKTKLFTDYTGHTIGSVLFLGSVGIVVAGTAGTVIPAAVAGSVISGLGLTALSALWYDTNTYAVNSAAALNCGPDQKVVIGTFFHFTEVVACQTPQNQSPKSSVFLSNNNKIPEHVNLISKTNLGYSTSCELKPNTTTPCPAEAYDYFASISAPGYISTDTDVSISQGQTTPIDATLQQLPNYIQLTVKEVTCQADSLCYRPLVTSVTGGTAPYRYQLDSSAEMSIDNSGYIHWQTGGSGSIAVHVCAIDANGMEGCTDSSITVNRPSPSSSSGSLSSTLSPARDLTGTWTGTYSLVASAGTGYGACSGTGSLTLQLSQSGNTLTGYFINNGDNPCWGLNGSGPLEGTISSSSFTFSVSDIGLTINQGRFTSNTMGGNGVMIIPGQSSPFSLSFSLSR